jgi:hypothetical protein
MVSLALLFRCSIHDIKQMGSYEYSLLCRYFNKYCPTGFNPLIREDVNIARLIQPHYHKVRFSDLLPVYGNDETDPEKIFEELYKKLQSDGKGEKKERKKIAFNKVYD